MLCLTVIYKAKKNPLKSGFIEFEIKKQKDYNSSICFNVVWLVVEVSAKPHDLEVLLQEEKQIIPTIQIATNTTFFIGKVFKGLNVHIFYELTRFFLLFYNVKTNHFILYLCN